MASPHDSELEAQRPSDSSTLHEDYLAPTFSDKSLQETAATVAQDSSDNNITPAQPDDTSLIVDWKGPDDPENPRNWLSSHKWAIAVTVSAYTFISPVSSSMVAPAAEQVAIEFGITNSTVLALTISIFVLAYAFGPLFLGPMSEIYGRVPVLHVSNIWFLAWNLACAFSQNKGQLIAFRFLAGLGGSAPMAIGGAVLSDMWPPTQRGKAIAIYSLAPLLGPVIGPVAGGWIAELSTWRWVFRSTTIAAAAIQILGFIVLSETFAPVLLERKVHKVLQKMDSGEIKRRPVRSRTESVDRHWKQILRKALVRPFLMLSQEPVIQLVGVYMAFVYGIIYIVLTTIPLIFTEVYHEKPGIGGLQYISLGIGLMLSAQVSARMLDRVYRTLSHRNGGVGKPEFRLPNVFPGTIILPAGLFVAGWGAQKGAPWIVPDIGFFLLGGGINFIWLGMQSYVIDTYAPHTASALAAMTFLRSLAGFGFPLFAPTMYGALGYGVGNSILAGAALAIGCPAAWAFWVYGERIRARSRHAARAR
ncbi:MFS polyamine transporter [Amylocystis lapponica]|nr:MFS polyamine transporter [Amylocystis lapponica]